MEMGPLLRVSSDKLEDPGIKLGTLGYKPGGLSTTPQISYFDQILELQ